MIQIFKKQRVLGLLLFMTLVACKTTDIETIGKTVDKTPEILTIILKITKNDTLGLPIVTVQQLIKAKGYLKIPKSVNSPEFHEGDLKIEILDAKNQVLQTTISNNPLDKSYEYSDENGHFQRTNVALDKEFISVRVAAVTSVLTLKVFTLHQQQEVLLCSKILV